MKKCDEILERLLQLTGTMVELADLGDGSREDVSCGVLYGLLRDTAFKIRKLAEQEKENHIRKGRRPEENRCVKGGAVAGNPDGGCRDRSGQVKIKF